MAASLPRWARRGAAVVALLAASCGPPPAPIAAPVASDRAATPGTNGVGDAASSDAASGGAASANGASGSGAPPAGAPEGAHGAAGARAPLDAASPEAGEPSQLPRSARVERVLVPGAGPVLVSGGAPESAGVLLYLHGRCGDPEAFRAFVDAVPRSLTLLSVKGDVKCKSSDRARWSSWAPAVDALLRRVVAAASARREVPLREAGWLVMGYSEGALRAEALLARFPERYVAGVLAGGPRAPRRGSLSSARRVVLMAGSLDARLHLIDAVDDLRREGVTARFDLLPGARHGEYGPEGEAVVGGALRWLLEAPGLQDRRADLADVQ